VTVTRILATLVVGLALAEPAAAAPRLEVGTLTRRLELPGLRACYTATLPGQTPVTLRFLAAGTAIFGLDSEGRVAPLLPRTNLFGVVSDPERGALLCTSRGVYATRDGRRLQRVTAMVFTRVIAAPVGGLFVRPGQGLFGFDGRRFHLLRAIPWRNIDSVGVEPGGDVWFVGAYTRPDGTAAPPRLYVARARDGQTVIEDPLPAGEAASAVAEYFGGIVATVNGELRGTSDGGQSWETLDHFGQTDLTLTSLPLYAGQPWEALWVGVRHKEVGPAPLWFDDYANGLVDQPINAALVSQIGVDLGRNVLLFVADGALFEAPYRVADDVVGP
jgi:hypothetical protein